MKQTLAILFALFCALSLTAQVPMCMPDSIIYGTDSLFWPLPYTVDAPNYNVNDVCIDHPYNQSLTINVPTTLTIEGTTLGVENFSIATVNAISNLPIGLTYACDPPNCVFRANTLGCIVLYGTPTRANTAPDTIDLAINASCLTNIAPFPFPITFPGPLFPASYYLTLKTAECLVGNYDLGNQFTFLKNAPNPFGNQTLITAELLMAGDFQFEVFDLLGQRLYLQKLRLETGRNEFTFDAVELANGAYFYSLSNREGKAVRRMIIAR